MSDITKPFPIPVVYSFLTSKKVNKSMHMFKGTEHGGLQVTGKTREQALGKLKDALNVLKDLNLVPKHAELEFI